MNFSSSFPELHSVTHLVTLLEFTLESYAQVCAKKRPSKTDLDRYESVLETIFMCSGPEIRAFLVRSATWALPPKPAPRVKTIMRYMDLGDDSTAAVHRYVLVHRYKNTEAHRE